jgi:hypothetical protein
MAEPEVYLTTDTLLRFFVTALRTVQVPFARAGSAATLDGRRDQTGK